MFDLEAFELANLQNLMLIAELFDLKLCEDYADICRHNNNQEETIHKLLKANKEFKYRIICEQSTREFFQNKFYDKQEKYDALEQKYWDSQRLIDQYDRENKELEREIKFWKNRYYERNDKSYIPLKNKYDELVIENVKLKNRLAIERIQAEENKRYLEAYQKLYVDECMKNRKDNKETLVDSFLAEIKKNVFKVDPKEE